MISNKQISTVQELQSFFKKIKDFDRKLLNQRCHWNSYGQNTAKASKWSEQLGNYLMEFVKILKDFHLEDMQLLEAIIEKIKEWFRNSAYEFQKSGQGVTGTAFADWLSSVQKLLNQLMQQTLELINLEKSKQESIILQKRIELDQMKRKRKQEQEKRQRSRQKKITENRENRQGKRRTNSTDERNREESQAERNKVRTNQMFIESQRKWLNEKLQRKSQECAKLNQQLSDQRTKMEFERIQMREKMDKSIQQNRRLTRELGQQKVTSKSLQTYVEELNRQITSQKLQIEKLKEATFNTAYFGRNSFYQRGYN